MNIGNVSGAILVGIGLVGLGVAYNFFVGYLERRHLQEGYTAILVVFGVLFTLGGVAIFDTTGALLALIFFACSGTPMIVGSLVRYSRARRQARQALYDSSARFAK